MDSWAFPKLQKDRTSLSDFKIETVIAISVHFIKFAILSFFRQKKYFTKNSVLKKTRSIRIRIFFQKKNFQRWKFRDMVETIIIDFISCVSLRGYLGYLQ